ncbi:33 kDa ribonucleoprotein, chloroplastic-like [Diospyros lotus]|uniref:33 kDa ribonucleoprotein, chloroplastic-like n=1 Tax=Diospyros lotus TaxID=55363 RepID=UPI002257A525|nr:33 kDa ribonucleoprotein, chloroplastic-like [Diospyros lotus]
MSVSMASTTSSSYSLPLCNKLPHLASEYSLTTTTHFAITSKTKPIQPLKLKPQFRHAPPLSPLFRPLLFSPFAASENFNTELAETESESETDQEEEEEEEEDDVDDDDEQTQKLSAEAGRLYVGNLPYSMTSSQLSEIFGEAGRVVSVEIVYDRVTDRSRGFAFVTMGSVEEAKEAIRMFDGSLVGGRTVKVNFPEVPRGGEREVMGPKIRSSYQGFIDSPHKIYAGNLAWSLTSQGLREAFADQPGLLSAKVIYDRDSGRSRGFGFITFSSAEEVESALRAMNGVEVEGRPLRLNMAEERAPSTPAQARDPESSFDSTEMVSSIGN